MIDETVERATKEVGRYLRTGCLIRITPFGVWEIRYDDSEIGPEIVEQIKPDLVSICKRLLAE